MSKFAEAKFFIKQVKKEKRLNTVIFFVTSICNEKCRHCFYWEELNQRGDLKFEHVEKISHTMPPITDLWVSGGEPFMRKDLPDLFELFYRNNHIEWVNLPTNGLFKDRAHLWLDRVLTNCPNLRIDLNVSLDGFEGTHEKIRGVPGCYQKTVDMVRSLPPLVEKHRQQLRVNMNTCLNGENADELIPFMNFVYHELPVDGQYVQLIRGNPLDSSLKTVPLDKLKEIYGFVRVLYEKYAERMFKQFGPLSGRTAKTFYVGTLALHNKIQFANYLQSTEWPMACTAGETFCVIDYNGDVRACELRGKLANLRDYDYDFSRLWADQIRRQELRQIVCDQCWCTHVCNIHDSLRYDLKTLALEIPFTYWQTRPSRARLKAMEHYNKTQ
jgi:MoaA/NifB/PqqE/SkfB family radical SAM enzyme